MIGTNGTMISTKDLDSPPLAYDTSYQKEVVMLTGVINLPRFTPDTYKLPRFIKGVSRGTWLDNIAKNL
jgi:hypothetical protein